MPLPGRIEGRISEDGLSYEIRQADKVLQSFPMEEAKSHKALAMAIKRNGWEKLA